MNIAESVSTLGLPEELHDDLCIVYLDKNQKPHNIHYPDCKEKPLNRDVYIASGTYNGKLTEFSGRSQENVERVLWLTVDCDFKDYARVGKEEVQAWSDSELRNTAIALMHELQAITDFIGVKLHRIDYTGYGICGYVYLGKNNGENVQTIRDMNGELVDRINEIAKEVLADPGVRDAGTRFTRLPGCPNTKNKDLPRQTETLFSEIDFADINELGKILTRRSQKPIGQAIPREGDVLHPDTILSLVQAIVPYFGSGQRHAVALGIAGILAKAKIPESQSLTIMQYLSDNSGDLEPQDRQKIVRTTYIRAREGQQVQGYFGLLPWMPQETVDWIDDILRPYREANTPKLTLTVSVPKTETPSFTIPESAHHGLIGDYIDLMRPTTEASDGYHLGVGLTIIGAMIGRRIYVNYGSQLYPNLYTLLVGTSGRSRKDTAIRRGTRLLTTQVSRGEMGVLLSNVQIVTDIASAQGIINALQTKPNTLFYLTEFSRLMNNAKREGTRTIVPVLIEAFDSPAVLANTSMSNPLKAEFPYTSILSATQPRILEGLLGEDDVHSGFINRWMVIYGESIQSIPWPNPVDMDMQNILFEQIHSIVNKHGDHSRAMNLDPAVMPFWNTWYDQQRTKHQTEEEAAMRVRYPDMVIKIALIYSVLDEQEMITQDHIERAIDIVEWMWSHIVRLIPGWGGTLFGKIESRLIQVLTDRGGTATKRDITQNVRNPKSWSTAMLNDTIEALKKAGVISVDLEGNFTLN